MADPARRIEIPFSDLAGVGGAGSIRTRNADFDLAEKFDLSRNSSREEVNIVTGNVLRVHGQLLEAGVRTMVVNFTEANKQSRPGRKGNQLSHWRPEASYQSSRIFR